MAAAASRRVFKSCRQRTELGDFDPALAGRIGEVFPGKRPRPLRGELIEQRDRIVAVQQDKMISDWESDPGAQDQSVLGGARDRTHVQDLVRSNFRCRWW